MPEITTRDLLTLQDNITGTVRYEVGLAREEFRTQLQDLKTSQASQDDRAAAIERELARIDERTRITAKGRTLIANLSPRQKAGLLSAAVAVGSAVLDGVRHLIVMAKGAVQP